MALLSIKNRPGGEMANTQHSKCCDRKVLSVQVRPRAHKNNAYCVIFISSTSSFLLNFSNTNFFNSIYTIHATKNPPITSDIQCTPAIALDIPESAAMTSAHFPAFLFH